MVVSVSIRVAPLLLWRIVVGILWLQSICFRVSQSACIPQSGCDVALAYYIYNQTTDGSVSTVASRFNAKESDILWYSQIKNTSASPVTGDSLMIPFDCRCGSGGYLSHNFSYTVVQGDEGNTIATNKYQFLTNIDAMTDVNSENLDVIYANNVLLIPVNCSCGDPSINSSYGLFATYVAEENDNADVIQKKFNISAQLIQQYNPLLNLNLLTQNKDIIFVPAKDGNGSYPYFNGTYDSSSNSKKTVVIGTSVGAAVLFAVLAMALFYVFMYRPWKQRKGRTTEKDQTVSLPIYPAGSYSEESAYLSSNMSSSFSNIRSIAVDRSVKFTYEELAAATDNFSIAKKIGQGGFGSVFYGEIRGLKLAIKKMNMEATKEFAAEVKVLTNVHHTNLVHLIGYCTVGSLFLVYEYVDNGTLSQHLKQTGREGRKPLPWPVRLQIALDAAKGLEYIHDHTTPAYIHRDIKSSNILIDKNFRAKVADFGLTKLIMPTTASADTVQSRAAGTYGYMAPEYAQCGDVSAKSDVYSFGVVLFELISAKDAIVRGMSKESDGQYSDGDIQGLVTLFEKVFKDTVNGQEQLRSLVDPALGDNYPINSVWKMANLARACTRESPTSRPYMREVVVALMTLMSSRDGETDHQGTRDLLPGLSSNLLPELSSN